MSKHNIVVNITAADKREVLAALQDNIEGQVCEILGLPYDVGIKDRATTKAIKIAAGEMYDGFLNKLLNEATKDIDVVYTYLNDYTDDYSPVERAARQLARSPELADKAKKAVDEANLAEAYAAAARVGMTLVEDND
jgi:hypothetical protein